MRVLVLSMGTRGDVELGALLGGALRRRGHRVTLAASSFHRALAEAEGLDWSSVGSGTREQLVALMRELLALPDLAARGAGYHRRWIHPQLAESMGELESAIARSDYVVNNLKLVWRRGGTVAPGAALTYEPPSVVDHLAAHATRTADHRGRILELVALNRQLVDPEHRWGDVYRFTGFWSHPERGVPSAQLAGFVDAGPPPVVLTLGSMAAARPAAWLAAASAALDRAAARAVIVAGWSELATQALRSERILVVEEAPYDWLLPRASCVVHHGGCGTVAATLRAGRPSIVMPHTTSQRNFAAILTRERLACGTLDPASMTADELADALLRAADPTVAAAAARWRETIRGESGLSTAADLVEAHAREVGAS
jgi:UDP:flavonoid glycosyltransferase YjiC (YdhE family)